MANFFKNHLRPRKTDGRTSTLAAWRYAPSTVRRHRHPRRLGQPPRDVAAFGLAYDEFSDNLRAGERQAQQLNQPVFVPYQETALEWMHILGFGDGGYFVQPDFQYLIQPSGTDEIPDAFVVGSQLGVNF